MTLTEMQELLNNLGAYFIVYIDNEDPRDRHIMLEVFHAEDKDTTLMAFDTDGINGMMVPACQKNSEGE